MLKQVNKKYYFTFIALFLFILPFFWFKNSSILLGGEAYIFSDFKLELYRNIFFWNHSFGLGMPNASIILQTYHLFNFLLDKFIPPDYVQKTILGAFLSLSFCSFYKMLKYLLSDIKYEFLILGALLYVFNPFYISMFTWIPAYGFMFIFFPLIFLQSLKIFRQHEKALINYIYLFIYSFVASPVAINLGLFFIIFFLIFMLTFYIIFERENKKSIMINFVLIVFTIIFSNLFWILPFAATYETIFGGAAVYSSNFNNFSLFSLPILNAITLSEYSWLSISTVAGDLFYPYFSWYRLPSQIILIALVIIILIGLSKRKYLKKEYYNLFIYFILIFIVGVLLTKGTAFPFGKFYELLLLKIKYFGIYRASDIKFPYLVIFSISFLLPLSMHTLKNIHIKFLNEKGFSIVIFALIIVLGLPFILGKVIPYRQNTIDSLYVSVPDYWKDFFVYKKTNDSEGRMLMFPKNYSPFDNYTWGYRGVYLPYNFLSTPVIGYANGYGYSLEEKRFQYMNVIYDLYEKQDFIGMRNALSIFGINSIIQRNDFDREQNLYDVDIYSKPNNLYEAKKIKNNLSKYFITSKSIGPIDVYSIPYEYRLSNIYIPESLIYLKEESPDVLEELLRSKKYKVGTAFYSNSQKDTLNDLFKKKSHESNIEIKSEHINPTKYRIIFYNINAEKIPLVFNESYSTGWRINLGKPKSIREFIEFKKNEDKINKSHIKINGYANLWIIDPKIIYNKNYCKRKDVFDECSLYIEYYPQRLFRVGQLIVVFLLLSGILILIYYKIFKEK